MDVKQTIKNVIEELYTLLDYLGEIELNRNNIRVIPPMRNSEDCQLNIINENSPKFSKTKEKKDMFKLKDGIIRQRPNGSYELRFRKYGYSKTICRKTKEDVIILFKEYLKEINKNYKPTKQKDSILLKDWTNVFFEEYKKPFVTKETLNHLTNVTKLHILKPFGDYPLNKITALDIQKYLNSIIKQGKRRTAEDAKTILCGIFDTAVKNEKLKKSPMEAVAVPKHHRVSGTALTLEEEKEFLKKIENNTYGIVFKFLLFTGCRRSEALSFRYDELDVKRNLLTIETKKVKNKDVNQRVTRTIPIFPKLKDILKDIPKTEYPLKLATPDKITHEFKKLMPNHHLHDLRHTFTTRARECGIDNEVVSLWTGHSFAGNTTSLIYTHFSMDYQQKMSKKLKY